MSGIFDFAELRLLIFWRDVAAEVLATFYMMVFVTFSFVTLNRDLYSPSTPLIGLMVGLVIFLLIEGYRPISGGHLNPCVSFAASVMARITPVRAVFYTCAQCLGSVLASLLVLGLTPAGQREDIVAFVPSASLHPAQAVLVEAVLIFNLIFVGLSVSDEKHAKKGCIPGLPTGLCVGTGIMAAGTFTGVCLNPIVALGPAVASGNFTSHWVYWVGDYLGASLAVLIYTGSQYIDNRHAMRSGRKTGISRDNNETRSDEAETPDKDGTQGETVIDSGF